MLTEKIEHWNSLWICSNKNAEKAKQKTASYLYWSNEQCCIR